MTKSKFLRTFSKTVLTVFIVFILMLVGNVNVYSEDYFENLRNRWIESITGGMSLNTSDPDIAAKLTTLGSTAQSYWNSMDKSSSRTYIFAENPTKFPNSNVTDT
jgi:hyaluronate lyase